MLATAPSSLLSGVGAVPGAAAVRMLAERGEVREALGVEAREVAGLFSWERIAGETAGFYGELVEP